MDIPQTKGGSGDPFGEYMVPSGTNIQGEYSVTTTQGSFRSTLSTDVVTTLEITESLEPTYEVPKILTVKKYRLYKKG